jgi:hypothetical protein
VTLAGANLELSFPRELQAHNATWDAIRFQQHEIGRSRVKSAAHIGEPGSARDAVIFREWKFDLHLGRLAGPTTLGIDRVAPNVPAGRDIAALDQRAAADKFACRRNGINID